jgi:hypothetical protein
MGVWMLFLAMIGLGDPQTTLVQEDAVLLVSKTVQGLEETGLDQVPMLINNKQITSSKRCIIALERVVIQRNLTLPYPQQTVYGTSQCHIKD